MYVLYSFSDLSLRAVFLATWREIPDSSERQYLIENVLGHTADAVADKMRAQGSHFIHSFPFLPEPLT